MVCLFDLFIHPFLCLLFEAYLLNSIQPDIKINFDSLYPELEYLVYLHLIKLPVFGFKSTVMPFFLFIDQCFTFSPLSLF